MPSNKHYKPKFAYFQSRHSQLFKAKSKSTSLESISSQCWLAEKMPGRRAEDFNSSDQEYDTASNKHARKGFVSIEAMQENMFEDRKRSKNRLREQEHTLGAPGSIDMRGLWLNRLDNYVAISKVIVDKTKGPEPDTLYRFLETIVTHIKSNFKNKPAPQLQTIKNAFRYISSGLLFRHESWQLSKHHAIKIDTLLDALTKEGKLIRGRWSKNQWLGTVLFEKMARAWLEAGLCVIYIIWEQLNLAAA
ncbi:hypothetical protein BJ875DRAFT_478206 [Amylocarpus encephaloides]|uniref:Uncharacterized protein n=1 Tax=Amylocarpus encephaloides TaxID=45428 RepID=A0A9P7Y5R0_9HELO|nr:hypothetical protein BJ875DRAFT_478206 [Amylocarpus encephaloides]